mmetsp:Transcript_36878/g.92463  ORF Transcript_36878/g.92463 Transcript_36878/m.92463 type:complete len:161 (-) Transcript_36878:592-1074(-)
MARDSTTGTTSLTHHIRRERSRQQAVRWRMQTRHSSSSSSKRDIDQRYRYTPTTDTGVDKKEREKERERDRGTNTHLRSLPGRPFRLLLHLNASWCTRRHLSATGDEMAGNRESSREKRWYTHQISRTDQHLHNTTDSQASAVTHSVDRRDTGRRENAAP